MREAYFVRTVVCKHIFQAVLDAVIYGNTSSKDVLGRNSGGIEC
jgi:hypothetical protein